MRTAKRTGIRWLTLACVLACAAHARADPAPAEALIDLAASKQQLSREQLILEIRRNLQRLAVDLKLHQPDIGGVTEDRLVVIQGDYDGSGEGIWQNRVVLVQGALELNMAMNCVIIVGGDLKLGNNEANFIVAGGNAEIGSNGGNRLPLL